jgi:hypothetical protein
MTKVTVFQAGSNVISTGSNLFEAVEAAQSEGINVKYNEIEMAKSGHGLVDSQIYYTNDYEFLMGE